jgi:hypothetical protein
VRPALAGIALLFGALVGNALLVGPAGAAPGDPPQSGDPRATAFAGNATTCEDAGLPGETIDVGASIDATNRYLTITSVPDGVTLTGVVVKGGPGYNVYVGDVRTLLHAPLGPNGSPAGISHWYACGAPPTTTSGPPPPSSPPPSSSTPPSSSPPPTTSSAPASLQPGLQPPSTGGGGLAATGAPVGAIAGLGGLLVVVGVAMLAVSGSRRRHLPSQG